MNKIVGISIFLFFFFSILFLFYLSSPASGRAIFVRSFGFVDTGQRLGQIIDGVASIASGDMNNDGFVDLVLASHEKGSIIQLFLNNGNGNFIRTDDTFPVTENPNPLWNFGIVLRDFNRDGLLDIATADAWRGVNIYLNTTNAGFDWSQAILVPEVNEVKGIDAADVDADGDYDIVFGGHNGIPDRGDRIYLNDGSGRFHDSGQRIGSDVTWDVAFGDLDNDGDMDYVSVNRYGEHTAKIHLNNGNGMFDGALDIPTTQTDDSYDVRLADLNMDGLVDILIANAIDVARGTMSKIFMNKGKLSFELAEGRLGERNCETKAIEVVDVDNDGHYDIVLGNYNIANMIYRSEQTGKYTKVEIEIPTHQTTAIAVADVNDDGLIDLIVGGASDGRYRIYLNDGAGLRENVRPRPPTRLMAKSDDGDIHFYWEPGFAPSGSPLQFETSSGSIGCKNAARLAEADLNGDGALDLIVGNGEELKQESEVYLNDGLGHFTFSGQTFQGYKLRDMTVGDIDADGDVDWIVATQGDGVKILKNDGTGVFSLWQALGSEYIYVRAVDVGDVDLDGDLDLLYGSVGNRIYFNDGNGGFVDSGQDLGDQYLTQVVKFADLDKDGDLDFVQGNRRFEDYDVADRVFFNNGHGLFIDSGQRLGQCATFDMDLADIDGDGDLDLVAVCSGNGAHKIYLNQGNGFFVDSGSLLIPVSRASEGKAAKFGDIDHDGDIDLVIGDWDLGPTLYLNDGYGHLTESGISMDSGRTGDIVVADIDQDGDLDIVESRKGDDCSTIHLNNQARTPQLGLTYNIRIGTQPEENNIVSGISSHGLGQLGNTLSYMLNGLEEGIYYWSVQAVDTSFKGSKWAQEQQFTVMATSPTPTPIPTPAPTATPTAVTDEEALFNVWVVIGPLIGILVAGGIAYYIVRRRR